MSKELKNQSKIQKWIYEHRQILFWAMVSIIFAVVIQLAFSIPAPNTWLEAKWGAGDILTYASTVSLGLLAVWQNQKHEKENEKLQNRMLQVEENTYVNDNACFTLIEDISIECHKQTACNLELHTEQVVFTFNEKPTPFNSSSLVFSVRMKNINSNIPTMLRIIDFYFISAKENASISFVNGKKYDGEFSRAALSEDYVEFQMTVFFLNKDKKLIVDNMREQDNSIIVEFVVELLTHKNVATTLKCRAKLIGSNYNEKEDTYSNYKIYPNTVPYCFWLGIKQIGNAKVKTSD